MIKEPPIFNPSKYPFFVVARPNCNPMNPKMSTIPIIIIISDPFVYKIFVILNKETIKDKTIIQREKIPMVLPYFFRVFILSPNKLYEVIKKIEFSP